MKTIIAEYHYYVTIANRVLNISDKEDFPKGFVMFVDNEFGLGTTINFDLAKVSNYNLDAFVKMTNLEVVDGWIRYLKNSVTEYENKKISRNINTK